MTGASPYRWRLHRAGVLNVWQYDDQVFDFADGRLLLRGTNGAGKSKTLEMLLPFLLDADRARMDASGRRGTALTWLMLDGYGEASRTGYLWLHLRRTTEESTQEHLTLGIGLRGASSTKSVNLWCFIVPGPPPVLDDGTGVPLSAPACREVVQAAGGELFESPRAYKAAVGRRLFGLDDAGYDELLRLLYWLRSPQVGESVQVSELDRTLSESLPELDRSVVDAAAASLDELQEFGEQVQRRERMSAEVDRCLHAYRRYAAGEVHGRSGEALAGAAGLVSAERAVSRALSAAESGERARVQAAERVASAISAREAADLRLQELRTSQQARDLEALEQLRLRRDALRTVAIRSAGERQQALRRADEAQARLDGQGAVLSGRRRELARAVADEGLRRVGIAPPPDPGEDLDANAARLGDLDHALGTALSAVQVCLDAVTDNDNEHQALRSSEEIEARALRRVEGSAELLSVALSQEGDAQQALVVAVDAWSAQAPVPLGEVDLLDVERAAAEAIAAPLEQAQQQAGRLAARLGDVDAEQARVSAERVAVSGQTEPEPPAPVLPRDPRDAAAGVALWRAVDLAPGVEAGQAAGLEAALQASGLLDALLTADGVLRGDDTVLVAGPAVPGDSLADLLVPAVGDGPVTAAAVHSALRRIALDGAGPAVVRSDGSWTLGVLQGRASKPQAQYLGIVAREAERGRRLAVLDGRLAALAAERAALLADHDRVRGRGRELTGWRSAAPSSGALRAALARTEAQRSVHERDAADAAETEQAARRQREIAGRAQQHLRRTAGAHGLPLTRAELTERERVLRDLRRDVDAGRRLVAELRRDLLVLAELVGAAGRATEEASGAELAGATAAAEADSAGQSYDARQEALSATQRELEQALAEAAADLSGARSAEKDAHSVQLGAERTAVQGAEALTVSKERLARAQEQSRVAEVRACALRDSPGLLASIGVDPAASWAELHGAVDGQPVADENAVHAAVRDLTASVAGALQPRLTTGAGGLFVLSARDDDATEAPLAVLSTRLAERVARDRALLTKQQREVCERHLLGELGEVLRRRRLDAESLVQHMNRLLQDVRTSQGIRVRLDWKLRDDLPVEARETVRLLDRPIGSLLPEQREKLLGLLSELIEAAHREDPDAGYALHLRSALDYRTWSAFAVRVRRAGSEAEERLTRRTALSQGEQKVVCYLPLFAAAAAHFSSVAAQAPLAPRFVLLDDAFPKIDVKTHPVLFGLLVDLELDWVITSERLWGDCETVPAVAVYEVLRSPTERGVLPFKHLWDGRRLTAVGA